MSMQARALIPVQPPHPSPLPSPWQSPASPLQTHPPPSTPPPTYDYAIIGTGITGTLTAYHLQQSHPTARIALLDARTACSGATGRNGGHTKAASYRTYAAHVRTVGTAEALRIARLEYANLRAVHALARELGIARACESWEGNTVDAVYDAGVFEEGRRAIGMLQRDAGEAEREEGGMAAYRIWEAGEAQRRFGVAGTVEVGGKEEKLAGAFEYAAGSIHAYRFTMGVLAKCVEAGADVYEHTPVTAIEPVEPSSPTTGPHAPRFSLSTPRAPIHAHAVIVATNAYTASLLPAFQTAIVPLRGQVTTHRPQPNALPPLNNTYSFIYAGGYEYMIPRPPSTHTTSPASQDLIIGGGLARLPHAGASEYATTDDSALNPALSTYLAAALPQFLAIPRTTVAHEWTGIMGATRDGHPFVGEVPGARGVWVAAGFNGHGMVLCAKSAEALVGMLRGKDVGWFPGCFGVGERLGKGEFGGRMDLGGCGVGDVEV